MKELSRRGLSFPGEAPYLHSTVGFFIHGADDNMSGMCPPLVCTCST